MKLAVLFCVLAAATALFAARACAQEESDEGVFIGETVERFRPDSLLGSSITLLPAQGPAWHSSLSNIPSDWWQCGDRTLQSGALRTLGGIAILTAGLYVTDHETYRLSRRLYERSSGYRAASDVIMHIGDGRTALGLAAAFAVYGWAGSDQRAVRTASHTVEAVIASGIVVQMLKRMTGRESPQAASNERGRWRPFPKWSTYNKHQARFYSFPSGHVTTLMATVTVLSEEYPEVTWLKPVGYTAVGLVALSLVNRGWHWYSDFPLAVAMGYTFGSIAAHRDDVATTGGSRALLGGEGLLILPSVAPTGMGVTLAYAF